MALERSALTRIADLCRRKLSALTGHAPALPRPGLSDRMHSSPEFMAGMRTGIEDYKAGRVYKLADLQQEERDA